jgi:hypothetical protein
VADASLAALKPFARPAMDENPYRAPQTPSDGKTNKHQIGLLLGWAFVIVCAFLIALTLVVLSVFVES